VAPGADLIHLDTHAVAWLYAGDLARFPRPVRVALEKHELVVSPVVELELQLLCEIGRVSDSGRTVLDDLSSRIGLRVSDVPFHRVVVAAGKLGWTRDPFDRLIVGQAAAEAARLVTRDRSIRAHYRGALWAP
jgi:PIN domain nuclease of toxin-antitoxin system